nr:unnamed protein product [Callosobruchus chinensis]
MLVKYGDVLRHENRCTFKPITCPAVGCDLDITKTDLLRHFRERHSDLIITTREIALSTLRSYENRLYVWENRPLIVQTRISGMFVYIRLTIIENEDINIRRIFYRVKLLDKTVPISLYSRKTPESRDMLKLNSKLLDNHVYFDLYDRRYERLTSRYLDSNTLHNLRCSICQFYSLPTTYTCQNRHNFCYTCFNRLGECTICQTRLKKVFSLEHLGRFIELPCYFKGSGWKFVQKPQEIARNEHTIHVWNLSEAKLVKRCL